MTIMEKEALSLPAKVGIGIGSSAGGIAALGTGAHLLKKLRSRSERIDLDKSILDAEEEATDIISEEMATKEAFLGIKVPDILKYISGGLTEAGRAYPKTTLSVAAGGGLGAGALGGHIAEDELEINREKLKLIQQYAKRRELIKGAPRFSSAEELLGISGSDKLKNLLERKDPEGIADPEGIEEDISPSAVPAAVPSDIEVNTEREEPVTEVEDPYAELLSKSAAGLMDAVKGTGRRYLDLLKGTTAGRMKGELASAEGAVKAAKGEAGALGSIIEPKDVLPLEEKIKLAKKLLLKERLKSTGTRVGTVAIPAGIGVDYALTKNVHEKAQEQQKVASDYRVFYLRMKLASEKLKKNVSGDTVIKEKDGEQEIQDVAITETKSKTQEN